VALFNVDPGELDGPLEGPICFSLGWRIDTLIRASWLTGTWSLTINRETLEDRVFLIEIRCEKLVTSDLFDMDMREPPVVRTTLRCGW